MNREATSILVPKITTTKVPRQFVLAHTSFTNILTHN